MSPTSALACSPPRSPTQYVRGALLHPTCITVLSTALCFAACYAGLVAAVLTVVGALVVAIFATRTAFVRNQLDAWAARQQHRHRDHVRTRRIEIAGPARAHQYRELAELVEELERADPTAATRFELEGMLDQFVEIARCHHRSVESLRYAPAGESPFVERSKMRGEILARRVRRREDCARRITRLADDLAAIDELLHLVAHHVTAAPSLPDTESELERRLWELDDVDAAMAELQSEHEAA